MSNQLLLASPSISCGLSLATPALSRYSPQAAGDVRQVSFRSTLLFRAVLHLGNSRRSFPLFAGPYRSPPAVGTAASTSAWRCSSTALVGGVRRIASHLGHFRSRPA